jgi:transcriptional regulator with XRE-family HTH domain
LLNLSTIDICQLANYNSLTMEEARANLGRILKQQRVSLPLTLRELSSMSGVSASHLGRIERGERFPSGSVLRKIAGPLGFEEDELFTLAGYLSPQHPGLAESRAEYGRRGELDPYVARVLAQEPIDVQRAVIGILSILNSIAKTTKREKKP